MADTPDTLGPGAHDPDRALAKTDDEDVDHSNEHDVDNEYSGDEDEDEDDDDDKVVHLGFADYEETEEALLSPYFPSKMGGVPAWLRPQERPSASELSCKVCKAQLAFLGQMYAPGRNDSHFHRTIYLFSCLDSKCQGKDGSARAFRAGLPRCNPWYGDQPPEMSLEECLDILKKHEVTNNPEDRELHGCKMPFKEFSLVIEDELSKADRTEALKDDPGAQKLLKAYADKVKEGEDMTTEDLGDMKDQKSVEDTVYTQFQCRVWCDPEQVVRYYRFPGARPLWLWSQHRLKGDSDVPACPHCQGPRSLEVQLMPQLLHFLRPRTGELQHIHEGLDYGTVVVYSCDQDCSEGNDGGYTEEFVHIQPAFEGDQQLRRDLKTRQAADHASVPGGGEAGKKKKKKKKKKGGSSKH